MSSGLGGSEADCRGVLAIVTDVEESFVVLSRTPDDGYGGAGPVRVSRWLACYDNFVPCERAMRVGFDDSFFGGESEGMGQSLEDVGLGSSTRTSPPEKWQLSAAHEKLVPRSWRGVHLGLESHQGNVGSWDVVSRRRPKSCRQSGDPWKTRECCGS